MKNLTGTQWQFLQLCKGPNMKKELPGSNPVHGRARSAEILKATSSSVSLMPLWTPTPTRRPEVKNDFYVGSRSPEARTEGSRTSRAGATETPEINFLEMIFLKMVLIGYLLPNVFHVINIILKSFFLKTVLSNVLVNNNNKYLNRVEPVHRGHSCQRHLERLPTNPGYPDCKSSAACAGTLWTEIRRCSFCQVTSSSSSRTKLSPTRSATRATST